MRNIHIPTKLCFSGPSSVTDCSNAGSIVHEKLRRRIDADPIS